MEEIAPDTPGRVHLAIRAVAQKPAWVFLPGFGAVAIAALLQSDVAAAAVALVLAAGASFHPLTGIVPPSAYLMDGVPDGPPRVWTPPKGLYFGLSLGALAGFITLLALDAPEWSWWVLVVAVGIGWLVAANDDLVARWHTRRLRQALEKYAPTTAMGFAGRSGGPWQLRMWEPFILASGERTVVINLHAKYIKMILAKADLSSPFIQLGSRGTDDLKHVLVPSIRAVFYVQNAQRNAAFLAHDHLTHVWLNHGDSDKPANFNPRHAHYDQLVVCGQAGIDRYARNGIEVAPEKFVVLGRPQAAGIEVARGPIASRQPPVVLYAPTWHGLDPSVNFSSLEKGPDIVQALLDRGATVVFRPHPLSYRWRIRKAVVMQIREVLDADREATGRPHVSGPAAETGWSVVDCANHADALISDVSSVVSDFLQSEKPYAMVSTRLPMEQFRAENSVAETAYVLAGDLSNLDTVLDDLLVRDPLAAARSERKQYVLDGFVGNESAEAFAAYVRDLVRRGDSTPHRHG